MMEQSSFLARANQARRRAHVVLAVAAIDIIAGTGVLAIGIEKGNTTSVIAGIGGFAITVLAAAQGGKHALSRAEEAGVNAYRHTVGEEATAPL